VGGADRSAMNLYARQGVLFESSSWHRSSAGPDYCCSSTRRLLERSMAKPSRTPLAVVEPQSAKYSTDFRRSPSVATPFHFLYEATGDETMFTDGFDPAPRAAGRCLRSIVPRHCPMLRVAYDADAARCGLACSRLTPRCPRMGSSPQVSHRQGRGIDEGESARPWHKWRRVGPTFMAANLAYRLVQQADAERVLVPRRRRQPWPPDAARVPAVRHSGRWSQVPRSLHLAVAHLDRIDPAARVVITTCKRCIRCCRARRAAAGHRREIWVGDRPSARRDRYNPTIRSRLRRGDRR